MYVILSFAIFIIGVFILCIFLFSKDKTLPLKYLALKIIALLSALLYGILLKSDLLLQYPHFFRVNAPVGYLLGPLHLLFVRSVLNEEKKIKKSDFLHFLPFVLHFLELIPFYLSPTNEKIELIHLIEKNSVTNFIDLYEGFLKAYWHSALKVTSFLIYLLYSIFLFKKFSLNTSNNLQPGNLVITNFVKKFISIKIMGFLLIIISLILHKSYPSVSFILIDLSSNIVLVMILYLLVRNPDLLYGKKYQLAYKEDQKILYQIYQFNNKLLAGYEKSPYESSVFVNMNYKILYFNKTLENRIKFGIGKKIKVGDDIREYLNVKTEPFFLEGFSKAIKGRSSKIQVKVSISEKVKEAWWEFHFTPIPDEKGLVGAVSLTTKNIDKEKKLEDQLIDNDKLFRDIAWQESHLLRAPVSNLIGISNLLLKPESSLELNEKLELVKHINLEMHRLDQVIKEIVSKSDQSSNITNSFIKKPV